MQYLSTREITKAAPAARRLVGDHPGLLDTSEFLRTVAERGFKPVYAAQGTPHSDSNYDATKGRHLVVAANAANWALVLLNSHIVHRKAWLGAGFFRSGESPMFVVGAAVSLQRWRGFETPLEQVVSFFPALERAWTMMDEWTMRPRDFAVFAEDFVSRVYLPGHKLPDPAKLRDEVESGTVVVSMYGLLGRVMEGRLPASGDGARRVKPVKGPDALMQASSGAFTSALEMVRTRHPVLDTRRRAQEMVFPTFHKA